MKRDAHMKNKEMWTNGWKILLVIALVIAGTSLFMNLSSIFLEKKASSVIPAEAMPAPEEEVAVIKVLAAGTADYGTSAYGSSDYQKSFERISNLITNYDAAVYGQKSLIMSDVSSTFADTLINIGFNYVALANEDSLKDGKTGVDQSMNYWNSSGVTVSGTNQSTDEQNKLSVQNISGVTVAFLSFTDILNDAIPENENYLINVYDEKRSVELVEEARSQADAVIVSISWSGANMQMPNDRQLDIARKLADAGASVIVGNAPDAVQPVAWIDDTLVFYSAGSLISDSETLSSRIGIMGSVDISKSTVNGSTRIELTNPRADLVISMPMDSGYSVQMMSEADTSLSYEDYSSVLHMMDDSIRIGGLE